MYRSSLLLGWTCTWQLDLELFYSNIHIWSIVVQVCFFFNLFSWYDNRRWLIGVSLFDQVLYCSVILCYSQRNGEHTGKWSAAGKMRHTTTWIAIPIFSLSLQGELINTSQTFALKAEVSVGGWFTGNWKQVYTIFKVCTHTLRSNWLT